MSLFERRKTNREAAFVISAATALGRMIRAEKNSGGITPALSRTMFTKLANATEYFAEQLDAAADASIVLNSEFPTEMSDLNASLERPLRDEVPFSRIWVFESGSYISSNFLDPVSPQASILIGVGAVKGLLEHAEPALHPEPSLVYNCAAIVGSAILSLQLDATARNDKDRIRRNYLGGTLGMEWAARMLSD